MIDKEYFIDNTIKNKTGFSIKFGYFMDTGELALVYSYKDKEISWFKSFDEVPYSFKNSLIEYYHEYTGYNPFNHKNNNFKTPNIKFEKNDIIITSKYGEEFLIICKTLGEVGTSFTLFIDGVDVKQTFNLELLIDYIVNGDDCEK